MTVNSTATLYTCVASSLVGSTTRHDSSGFLGADSRRARSSKAGIRYARVFPEPVRAWTETSLWVRRRGIVEDWTGVGRGRLAKEEVGGVVEVDVRDDVGAAVLR